MILFCTLFFSLSVYPQSNSLKTPNVAELAPSNSALSPIKIAIMEDNSPYSFVLPNGKAAGLYVDIWRAWSQVTDRSVIFLAGSYAENISQLKSGEADMHAGLFVNPERESWSVFSIAIDRVPTGLFFHGDATDTPSLEQLGGKSVSVAFGSFQESYLKNNYPDIKVVIFFDTEETIRQLLSGEISAIMSEPAVVNSRLAQIGSSGALLQREQAIFYNTAHALIPKRNKHLVEIINQGISRLPIDKMIKLERKWLPGYPAYFQSLKTSLLATLSLDEQKWLLNHNRLVLGVDPAWSPFEFIDKEGKYAGISSEFVALIAKKLSVEMVAKKGLSWNEVIDKVKRGELDVLPGVARTKEREKYLVFSEPYLSFPNVVVTREDAEYIQSMADLNSRIVAVVDGYAITELLKRNHPDIELRIVNTITEGLDLVQDNKVFAYVDNFASVTHYINANKKEQLKVAIFTEYKDQLTFGIRKGLEPLIPIINKALQSISVKERKTITNAWLSVRLNVGTDFLTIVSWGIPTLLLFMLVIMFILRSNNRMQAEIKRRILTESELAKAKAVAEKANLLKIDFLANMSHEIRTPMNAVLGMSHLLEKTRLDPEQRGYIDTLNDSSAALLILIDDILDLSKIEAGKLELERVPFSLSRILQNTVQQIKVSNPRMRISGLSEHVNIQVSISEDIPDILVGDGLRLGQILLNLTGNAAKFTQQGSIKIEVKREIQKGSEITLHFVVKDTGIGIAKEQMEGLFETYSQADTSTTRHFGGTGLGLSISKSLCHMMNGKIWVESEVGEGSLFHFTAIFDYDRHSEKDYRAKLKDTGTNKVNLANGSTPDNVLGVLAGKKVLLVDDNLVNLTIAKKMLTNSGMLVSTAMSGQECLDRLQQQMCDIVLMDIQMPGMDGYATTQVIRNTQLFADVPVIGLSANVMEKDIQQGIDSGMNDYLGKPINLNKMLETLAKYLTK